MRVVLAGGGSAGHIEPALALADALRGGGQQHPGDLSRALNGALRPAWCRCAAMTLNSSRPCRCPAP